MPWGHKRQETATMLLLVSSGRAVEMLVSLLCPCCFLARMLGRWRKRCRSWDADRLGRPDAGRSLPRPLWLDGEV